MAPVNKHKYCNQSYRGKWALVLTNLPWNSRACTVTAAKLWWEWGDQGERESEREGSVVKVAAGRD